MKIQTYLVSLPELDIAFDQDRLNAFQKELDEIVGYKKCGLVINPTPYNSVTSYMVVIWALGKSEEKNREIVDKIKQHLTDENILFTEYTSYLFYDEEKIYVEFPQSTD